MDTATDPVVKAANVAVAILDAFDTVPVPPLLDFKPAVRIGLHAGNRMKQYLKFYIGLKISPVSIACALFSVISLIAIPCIHIDC